MGFMDSVTPFSSGLTTLVSHGTLDRPVFKTFKCSAAITLSAGLLRGAVLLSRASWCRVPLLQRAHFVFGSLFELEQLWGRPRPTTVESTASQTGLIGVSRPDPSLTASKSQPRSSHS